MIIFYHIPSLDTIYAGRTIYAGYKNAFEDLGHQFYPLTARDDQRSMLDELRPDILVTALNDYNLKFLDLDSIKQHRKRGLKVFINVPFWKSPISRLRINETPSVSENKRFIDLIRSGSFGDVYYNACERADPRMEGFEKATGYQHHTILLAADRMLHFPEYSDIYKAEISYVGTYLPEKRTFFRHQVFPLKRKYDLRLYGQDWSILDRAKGFIQKVGQYFNIPFVRTLQKPKLELSDERKIYHSSVISINIHEDYQKRFGVDFNERTFKIPACGGFEITDNVASIGKYLKDGEEIIIAKNKDDWFDKIDYYIRNPNKRLPIIQAGREKVIKRHTYHNRVEQMIDIHRCL